MSPYDLKEIITTIDSSNLIDKAEMTLTEIKSQQIIELWKVKWLQTWHTADWNVKPVLFIWPRLKQTPTGNRQ
jgi:hypothetical protein